MWRFIGIAILAVVVVATVAHAASMTGIARTLGAGTATVPHAAGGTCQLTSSTANQTADVIASVQVTVSCSVTGSYSIGATVVSVGNSSNGATTAALTANTPAAVTVTLAASVSAAINKKYTITYTVTKL